ncbi:AraC family transcriptional regulator [Brevibacterium sp. VCM10]|uniref:AraC family transcriptional regulator n=1 Tax=Brevibacterium sp. VCM10 TaxID=1381751 RepID=UPI00046FA929|nr:AraC family transcriptional regulator [Brevibacterium sp. VCM10]
MTTTLLGTTGSPHSARHRSLSTRDPDRAHSYVEEAFAEHRLMVDRSSRLRFRLDTAEAQSVTVGRMAYGTRIRIAGPEMRDCYHVNLLVSGKCTVAQNGTTSTFSADRGVSGVVFGPDTPVFIDWSEDCSQYHLKLPRAAFEAHAARLAGHSSAAPIDFNLTFSLGTSAGRSLLSSVTHYYSQLACEGGLATMPQVQRELESALMTQVLMVAQSNLTPRLFRDVPLRSETGVSAIIDYVDQNAAEELTIEGLAARAGTTARSLQTAFRKAVDMSPTEYIRHVRLGRARQDLLAGDAGSVSEIAQRWQFHHLGRFAESYRRRYGETPSRTLRTGGRGRGA